jgi:hypothetical protein
MDKELESKTVCCIDHGSYTEVGLRLAREFGRVLYFKPWVSSSPQTFPLIVGDGFNEMERIPDIWDRLDEIDLFVFPDLYFGPLQLHLESLGKRVWGARNAERYEYDRELFVKTLKEIGLPVPKVKVCVGITALREYLMENENQYIKISTTRGDSESWHHINYDLSQQKLNAMLFYYGPVSERVRFQVWDHIESAIEIGYDGPTVDGQFFDSMQGFEKKNLAYIGAWTKYSDMPEAVREVNEAFAPILKAERCRSMFGSEVRVTEDSTPYFIDATIRTPCPPGESQLEMYTNLGEVMWHGSVGDVVPIEPAAKFAVQVMLYSAWAEGNWCPIEIPDKVRKWVKLFSSCKVNDLYYAVPDEMGEPIVHGNTEVGGVVGLGDTIEEAIDACREHCDELKGFDLDFQFSELAECLKSIRAGEDQDVEFTKDTVPEPESVIEEK